MRRLVEISATGFQQSTGDVDVVAREVVQTAAKSPHNNDWGCDLKLGELAEESSSFETTLEVLLLLPARLSVELCLELFHQWRGDVGKDTIHYGSKTGVIRQQVETNPRDEEKGAR